jgi:hypothetical protein
MADIQIYSSLEQKSAFFNHSDFWEINTKNDLELWFKKYVSEFKKERPVDYIFRGMSDAKFKLFTSAQRCWIQDNMNQWRENFTYFDFIKSLVNKAKNDHLIHRTFELYDYQHGEMDFPVLSLLQHYGAPTPLLDWSYNIKSAAFFAIDGVKRNLNAGNSVDNYMSVYSIHRKRQSKELLLLSDFNGGVYPSIDSFSGFGDESNPHSNATFLISDFEDNGRVAYPHHRLTVSNHRKPYTSLFNQNIIPQEGLLMYNPFSDRPVEQLFNIRPDEGGWNLDLEQIRCFNIHKDLSEYLRRLLLDEGINHSYIYPHLYDNAKTIKESVLNAIVHI